MSAAHLEQMFLAPRDFLKMNLLYLIGTLPSVRGVYHFSYEPAPGTFCQRQPGFLAKERHPTRVWHVRLVPRWARGAVPAYFLPCIPGQLSRGVLPRDGQFMLAASQPGSVFGVARYRHGMIEACHAGADGQAGGARMGRETAWCSARLAGEAPLASSIIGVNNARQGWQFHAQRWEKRNALLFHYHDLITL
ncbi:MAG: hypothetical protein K5Q68_01810 [Roseococcus sp.]|nr:hypothetical protein [Roseococcus sp.]